MADIQNGYSYKKVKEDFVSNLNGTSLYEISLLFCTEPICVLLNLLVVYLIYRSGRNLTQWACFVLDIPTLILPGLFVVTIAADYKEAFLIILTILATVCFMKIRPFCHDKHGIPGTHIFVAFQNQRHEPFISHYRAYVLISTIICILAVDFQCFPRRLAKVETYGTGFMDCGVAGFIFSHGIVSLEARLSVSGRYQSSLQNIVKSLISSIPLVILGMGRLLAIKGSDYQEHVTEYGVHWNFFFTIATIKVLGSIVLAVSPAFIQKYPGLIGIGTALLYEALLTPFEMKEFLLHGYSGQNKRNGFLEANREGILSSLGYVSFYFISVQIGMLCLRPHTKLMKFMVISDILCWILLCFSLHYIGQISRRMVNISYIIWQVALQLFVLAMFAGIDLVKNHLSSLHNEVPNEISKHSDLRNKSTSTGHRRDVHIVPYPAYIIQAVNRNQLVSFLLANILTGIVNICIETIHVNTPLSVIILCVYLFTTFTIIFYLHTRNVTLKFW